VRKRVLSLPLAAACLALLAANAGYCQAPAGELLSLENYRLTFDEEFKTLSISARGPYTRWIAHTPWNGDFGDAQFVDPTPNFPFTIAPGGGLRIEARKGGDGKWRSGLICSRNSDGPHAVGFAQKYGYFEMRAKLPLGAGVWPAFWLIGVNKEHSSAEIDVMEEYGVDPRIYHAGLHIWRKAGASVEDGHAVTVPPGTLTGQFNDYGVRIDPRWIVFYFNRNEVWRTPTAPEFRQPFYILADLALGGGWPIDKVPSPSIMEIKYVRAYQEIPPLSGRKS
jgi:beta-glucanase (GH16 family)